MKFLRWIEDQILFKLQRRCAHPGRMVSVDILEGSSYSVATRYCNRCGAVALDYNGTPAAWRRPDPNLWFCWKEWKLENRWGDTTAFTCPWFAFWVSFGGYAIDRHAMVCGFQLWWSPMVVNGPASMFARKCERIFAYTRPRYERQL